MKESNNNHYTIALVKSGRTVKKECLYDFVLKSKDRKLYEYNQAVKAYNNASELDSIFNINTAGYELNEVLKSESNLQTL